ncbi:MAG: hypothetical protein WA851_20140, partial [Xanthobacteraceae bacterium]
MRIKDRLLPGIEMQVLGRPGQQGKRYRKIVMLPGRAFVDDTIFTLLALKRRKLLKGVSGLCAFGQTDVLVAQFGEQKFEQERAADIV